ncbi:MAG: AsnC family transcriptional regulator, partial [Sulfuritalea sp.]|nr:AsnC family transcriptional regulator [Sulfuritalea sp.]
MPTQLDEIDRKLINALQGDFPLVREPYRQVAEALGMDEHDVLRRLDLLLERKVLTRFGPMFQIERAGGAFVLAAMKVPEPDFERVAAQVNAF